MQNTHFAENSVFVMLCANSEDFVGKYKTSMKSYNLSYYHLSNPFLLKKMADMTSLVIIRTKT